MARAVESMGYEVKCNIGSSAFKMDMGIVDPGDRQRYLMGILLDGEDIHGAVENMLSSTVTGAVPTQADGHLSGEEFRTAASHLLGLFTEQQMRQFEAEAENTAPEKLSEELLDTARANYAKRERMINEAMADRMEPGKSAMRELERVILLRVVDEYWMDHIDAMTELRQGIGLRAYAQNDPVVAYKEEGYEMFENMVAAIQEETLRRLFLVRLRQNEEVKRERVAKVTSESGAGDGTVKKRPVKKVVKIGRNDPCPCGSGLKWKKCTCAEYHKDV